MKEYLKQLSGCFSTLEVLTLGTAYAVDTEAIDEVPQLRELKQLTLIGDPSWNVTLTCLTALLSLSPKLEKLILKFEMDIFFGGKRANYEREGPWFLLEHLKTVQVCCYSGYVAENEILMFFFNQTRAPIKRVVFDSKRMSDDETLRRWIPSSVELTFI